MFEGQVQPHAGTGVFSVGAKEGDVRSRLFQDQVLIAERHPDFDVRGNRRHAAVLGMPEPLDGELSTRPESERELEPVAANRPLACGPIPLDVRVIAGSKDGLGVGLDWESEDKNAENADDQRRSQAWSITK